MRNITELTALCNRAGRYHGLLKGRLGTYAIWQKSQETEQCHLKGTHKKLVCNVRTIVTTTFVTESYREGNVATKLLGDHK